MDVEKWLAGVELETVCDCCQGLRGAHDDGSGQWRDCGWCGGSGFVATELGEKLLVLVRHNMRRLLVESRQMTDDPSMHGVD